MRQFGLSMHGPGLQPGHRDLSFLARGPSWRARVSAAPIRRPAAVLLETIRTAPRDQAAQRAAICGAAWVHHGLITWRGVAAANEEAPGG